MKKTTVVIPNYNGIKYLEDCLYSLYDSPGKLSVQDGKKELPFAVIVVDNGSTDGSVTFLRKKFPQVRVICFAENTGFCGAVNAGIQAAETPYVMLLNNDTAVEQNAVEKLTQAIEQDDRIFSVCAKMVCMDRPEILDDAGDFYCALGWAFARGKGKPAKRYEKPGNVFACCGGASLYRRKVLLQLGLFDEAHFAYLEDMDIGWRAKIYGYRNVYEPAALVRHAGSGFSGSRYNAFKVRLSSRNSVYLIGKNMPLVQLILNFPFLCLGFFIKFLFFIKKGYGGLYLQGLLKGFAMCFSEDGREKKVSFSGKNLRHYVWIQLELWYNMFRRALDF